MERKGLGLTDKQEELLAKLSPELKEAFSNKVSTTACPSVGREPKEYLVIMMLLEATTNSGQLVSTLIDLASDTNYISYTLRSIAALRSYTGCTSWIAKQSWERFRRTVMATRRFLHRSRRLDRWKTGGGLRATSTYQTSLQAAPEELDEGSEWQQGPGFLRRPEAEGPGKMASEIATNVADDVKRLQRKAFSAVVTRSQTEKFSGPSNTDVGADSGGSALQPPPKDQCPTPAAEKRTKKPRGVALVRLVGPKRFSSLSKLSGTVAWIRRAVESWLNTKYQASSSPKLEARGPELSVEERTIAFQDLAIVAQDIVFIVDSSDLRSVSQVGGVKTVC